MLGGFSWVFSGDSVPERVKKNVNAMLRVNKVCPVMIQERLLSIGFKFVIILYVI